MKRHLAALSLCAAFFCFAPGCLFVRHATRVEREKEALRPVQFESDQAKEYFVDGVHELQTHKQVSDFKVSAVPFLWWNSSNSELSNNAIYNDQISACDTNGDGIIDMQEAIAYRAMVAERMRAMEMTNASSDGKPDKKDSSAAPVFTSKTGSKPDSPPALIHLSSQSSGP